ncbi:hypothetical protein C8P66_13322 [Humitalea rosea]|uniref:Uncharacterized protein n=1 Tax=Humitalea rosea TaxID=990373 RepID=A0A2W7HW70_9PROT|nr:hypothetical protein [Humitalea rosea]PZW38906.1 hypothetical protein C8P66_13322 [Humitalea rosea]
MIAKQTLLVGNRSGHLQPPGAPGLVESTVPRVQARGGMPKRPR